MEVLTRLEAPNRLSARPDLLERLQEVNDLPTLPTVFVHLIRAMRNPHVSVREISQVIESDQAITVKILRLINSSFYGLSRNIESVHMAIVLLGANTLKNVVISASVFKTLGSSGGNAAFSRQDFWQHSLACGMIARFLGNQAGCNRDEEAFIAGLIHDSGKLVLDRYFPDEFREVLQQVQERQVSFYEAEQQVLGCSHAEIGAHLAEKWSLPDRLVRVIAEHHRFTPVSPSASLVALVQVADMLARRYRAGSGGDPTVPEIAPEVWEHLRLTPEKLTEWDAELQAEITRSKEMLELLKK